MNEPIGRSPLEKRVLIALVTVLVLGLASLSVFFLLRPKPIVGTVKLGAVPAAYYLPLMVAVDQHLFEKYGYRGELDISNNNDVMMSKFLRGEDQVTALGSGGVFPLQSASPGRVRFIYGQNSKSYSFLVPRDSSIQDINDLKGKRIGTWQSATPRTLLHLMLDDRIGKEGFTIVTDDSKRVNELLTSGSVDVLYSTDVFTQQAIESNQVRMLSRNPIEDYVMKPFFNGGGLVLQDLESKQPEVYSVIVKVMRESIQFIADHPEEARRSLVRHIGVAETVARDAPIDEFVPPEAVDRRQAQRVADLLYEAGLVKRPINIADLF